MYQSGKIVAYCSAALSAAAIAGGVGFSFLFPWIGPISGVTRLEGPGATSDQAKTPAALAMPSADVRALALEVAGPDSLPGPQAAATEAALPLTPEPAAVPEVDPAAPPPQWSQAEVDAALMQCVSMLAPVNAQVIPLAPIRYNDCGTPAPVLLRSIGGADRVVVDPPMLMNCPMVVALSRWIDKTVQPAARSTLGSPVARIVGSGYACRNLYNLPNERRSQHAFADAIDLPVFFLADGRRVDLATGWGPTRRDLVAGAKLIPIVAKEGSAGGDASQGTSSAKMSARAPDGQAAMQASVKSAALIQGDPQSAAKAPAPDPLKLPQAKFLRQVHQGACKVFTTVLGPEANDIHRTHLHLDLQDRHSLNVCK
jgi:hypothetical protein